MYLCSGGIIFEISRVGMKLRSRAFIIRVINAVFTNIAMKIFLVELLVSFVTDEYL